MLWHPAGGPLTNLSTCSTVYRASGNAALAQIVGVHSSLLGTQGYPSTIAVTNASSVAQSVPDYLYDSRDGRYLGYFDIGTIPANGTRLLDVATIEAGLKITLAAARELR